jgi:hypothetical protein
MRTPGSRVIGREPPVASIGFLHTQDGSMLDDLDHLLSLAFASFQL